MRKISALALFAFFCGFYPNFSQTASPYQFLRSDASARSAGLAGAFTAFSGDASAMFYNPAAVMTLEEKRLGATFLKHTLDINSGTLTYNSSLENVGNPGAFAVGVNFMSYGSFDRADALGNKTGTFGGYDLALEGVYGNRLDSNLFYGVALKFIANSLENTGSSALALDAGILYRIAKSRTNIGFSVLHAGTQLSKIGSFSENLPLDVRLGVNHRLKGLPLLLNFGFSRLADSYDNFFKKFEGFALGGEFYFGKAVQVRLGYDNQRRRDLSAESRKKLTGVSAGVGIVAKNIAIDYAISVVGLGGTLNRFTVNYSFL